MEWKDLAFEQAGISLRVPSIRLHGACTILAWLSSTASASASDSCAPALPSHGARLRGGREVVSSPWFNLSRASFKSSSSLADNPRRATSSKASREARSN